MPVRGPQGVGPHVLNVILHRDTTHPTAKASCNAHLQRHVMRVHHIPTLDHEQAVQPIQGHKAGVIQQPLEAD